LVVLILHPALHVQIQVFPDTMGVDFFAQLIIRRF